VSRHSSALGLPPGLRVHGEPGQRVMHAPSGMLEFTEDEGGTWMICTCGTGWEQWRQLAQLILDTPDPGRPDLEGIR
jgi:hypothetical protein